MLARVQSYLLQGIDALACEVEVDTDVGGARRAGLDGILVAGNESSGSPGSDAIEPDHRIDRLTGLLA